MSVFKTVPEEDPGTLFKKGGGLAYFDCMAPVIGISVSLPAVSIVCMFSSRNMFFHVIDDELTFIPIELPRPCIISVFIQT
jgi:hypothetical protein